MSEQQSAATGTAAGRDASTPTASQEATLGHLVSFVNQQMPTAGFGVFRHQGEDDEGWKEGVFRMLDDNLADEVRAARDKALVAAFGAIEFAADRYGQDQPGKGVQ